MTRPFDRVVVIMFENQYRSYVLANEYFAGLARRGIDLAGSFGVMHPSQTNYIASIAGELCNVTGDDATFGLQQRTIVDLIEESPDGLEWRAYMDGYTASKHPWSPIESPHDDFPYVVKHNPFASFASIRNDPARWARIVPLEQFLDDVDRGELPAYSWITPDMWHDGHYITGTTAEPAQRAPQLVDQAAEWLESFFATLRFPGPDSRVPPRTLVVVTFDESDFEQQIDASEKYTYDGPNQIYTVLLGDHLEPSVESDGFNHYSLLRTIEENFALGTLGKNDRDSNWYRFLWGERFGWSDPAEVPFRADSVMAAATIGSDLHVIHAHQGRLVERRFDGTTWSEAEQIDIPAPISLAVTASHDELVLVAVLTDGTCRVATFTSVDGWVQDPHPPVLGPASAVAATALDGGDFLIAVRGCDGSLRSVRRRGRRWNVPRSVGFSCEASFALGSLGASVYLVYEVPSSASLNMLSMNTAEHNVVTVPTSAFDGPWNDTTIDLWSPSAYPVAHYSSGPDPRTPQEPEPTIETLPAAGPIVLGALDGELHLVHQRPDTATLVSEVFSIAGLLTPRYPVSYEPADDTTTSNGYGTPAQAGWTDQRQLVNVTSGTPATVTRRGDELVLFLRADDGSLHMTVGAHRVT